MTKADTVSGTYALIPGETAAILVRLLGTWTRSGINLTREENHRVAEAVVALQDAVAQHRAALPPRGSGEVEGKCAGAQMQAWISTRQVAEESGRTPRWVRMLQADGKLGGAKVDGRLRFPPTTPERVRALSPTT